MNPRTKVAAPVRMATGALGLAAILALWGTPAAAEIRAIEGAVEATRLFITPGDPGHVRAVACRDCPDKTFALADDYKVFVSGDQVPRKPWAHRQGDQGTVIYNLETGRAVRLNYYGAPE